MQHRGEDVCELGASTFAYWKYGKGKTASRDADMNVDAFKAIIKIIMMQRYDDCVDGGASGAGGALSNLQLVWEGSCTSK